MSVSILFKVCALLLALFASQLAQYDIRRVIAYAESQPNKKYDSGGLLITADGSDRFEAKGVLPIQLADGKPHICIVDYVYREQARIDDATVMCDVAQGVLTKDVLMAIGWIVLRQAVDGAKNHGAAPLRAAAKGEPI